MLLEFKTKNFKSFNDEIAFKLIPEPIKGIDYSVLHRKINKKEYKALSAAVIYGPNSSGKTNIIGAIEVLKNIVLRGNIKNTEEPTSPNYATARLELIPNIKKQMSEPVVFDIRFIAEEILFEYYLCINLGKFLDTKYKREVFEEKLSINEKMIYHRKDSLEIGDIKAIKGYLVNGFNSSNESIARDNINKEELFLTTYFKTLYSAKITEIIQEWFKEKLIIIYRADSFRTSPIINESRDKLYVDGTLNSALKIFGLTGENIAYSVSDENGKTEPVSLIDIGNEKVAKIPADIFESFGTIRFMNIFPILLEAILYGKTVAIDEFDASIHPMALMSIINIFHNDDINTKGAQLIFNTHNPIFLNKNLFRRDEIKFVERDEETGISTHYSLSDFGTSGENAVRNSSDYMRNYFVNRYGAIKNIDFSDVFINDESEDTSEV